MKTEKANGQPKADDDPQRLVVEELRELKGLMVLLLMKGGASQGEIAQALGVNQSTVSRRYGVGDAEPFSARLVGDEAKA
jgi:DNA-directed RNA polymerase specialized sigma24 family protein